MILRDGRYSVSIPTRIHYVVPAAAVHPLPDGVPAARGVLAANMETAVNVAWDARPAEGQAIVVIGGGVVGLLAARRCGDETGAPVLVVDPCRAREAAAHALGLAWRPDPPPEASADLVIHASGTAEGLRAALRIAAVDATIVEASWYGTRAVLAPARRGVPCAAADDPEQPGGTRSAPSCRRMVA